MKSSDESSLGILLSFLGVGLLGTVALTFRHMRQSPELTFAGALVDGKWWLIGMWLLLVVAFFLAKDD